MPTSLADLPLEYVDYDVGPAVITTSIVMTVATVVLVAVRFAIRSRSSIGLGIDDWLVLGTLFTSWRYNTNSITAVHKGGAGRHLVVNMLLGMERIEAVNLYLYIGEYLYFTLVAVIKASILAMYYRIFPTRTMKWGVYILGVTVILWWIAIILVTIFQCQPVSKAYKPFMPTGSCLEKEQFFFGNSIPNVIQDVFILVLPAREVWRLQVSIRQKIAILGVFVLGFAVVIIGCIRLKSLLDLVHSEDFTGKPIAVAWIWTIAEPFTGIIAACLPTLRPLLGFLFSRAFSTARSTGPTPGNTDNDGRTVITIGGGRAKVGGGYSKQSSKNSRGLSSFTQLDEGDSEDSPRLWPTGYPSARQVSASGPTGRNRSFVSDEIPLDSIAVKRDVTYWSENKGRRTG
ncbi:integral membrane [Naviculisporaceae sp. PSN 640]